MISSVLKASNNETDAATLIFDDISETSLRVFSEAIYTGSLLARFQFFKSVTGGYTMLIINLGGLKLVLPSLLARPLDLVHAAPLVLMAESEPCKYTRWLWLGFGSTPRTRTSYKVTLQVTSLMNIFYLVLIAVIQT